MGIVTATHYLKRIQYTGSTQPTLENLRALASAHLSWVPFENMDMLEFRPLNLTKEGLWDKIVTRRRGGVCHELNNAFAHLLRDLGYTVTLRTANVVVPDDQLEHTNFRVIIEGETWLVDVGFGSHVVPVLSMDSTQPQEGYGCSYILRPEEDGTHTLLCRDQGEEEYTRLYTCYPQERQSEDVFHSYLPLAEPGGCMFVEHYVVARVTPTAKYSLFKEKLTITEHGEKTVVNAPTESIRRAMLVTYFGISL